MKTDNEIIDAVKRAREIVKRIYVDDPRIQKASSPDSGIARETDIVFKEIMAYLLNE